MTTNAQSVRTAVRVADLLPSEGKATLRLTSRLAGEVRGGVRYGDATTERTIRVGVRYEDTLADSLALLGFYAASEDFEARTLASVLAAGLRDEKTGAPITLADVHDAIYGTAPGRKGLLTSLRESFAGINPDATSAHVFEPFVLDGETVPGVKVYRGPGNAEDPRAPVVGTLYIEGWTVDVREIAPAPNGPVPASRRGAVAVVKDWLSARYCLPHAQYRTFRLLPGEAYTLDRVDPPGAE